MMWLAEWLTRCPAILYWRVDRQFLRERVFESHRRRSRISWASAHFSFLDISLCPLFVNHVLYGVTLGKRQLAITLPLT
ncbi:unnamed protein product [Zymoseptoria tritici ST99CH_3D7]|uniref:Uncharacterized protein n=1 Tax=Zymoseptoria tritici (strain ST99CH_3D7) TaxID=1276538 RepID=A0A1X7RPB4_ZYMT9|nr:unnamed protein product [Zymoseptoria tritici ST99CH_3D7]